MQHHEDLHERVKFYCYYHLSNYWLIINGVKFLWLDSKNTLASLPLNQRVAPDCQTVKISGMGNVSLQSQVHSWTPHSSLQVFVPLLKRGARQPTGDRLLSGELERASHRNQGPAITSPSFPPKWLFCYFNLLFI